MSAAASTSVQHPSTSRSRAASRLMLSVRRTLSGSSSSRRRPPDYQVCTCILSLPLFTDSPRQTPGLLSTQEESAAPPPFYQFRDPDPAASRPTVEQIAMGLHLSRTPHLRPLSSSPYAFPQRNPASLPMRPYDSNRSSPISLPPPPTRSSLKKPSTTITSSSGSPMVSTPFSSASASTTTVTSAAPSSNSPKPFAGIKLRMARFLPHNKSFSAPTSLVNLPLPSPRNSISEIPPKKAVRFTTDEERS